MSRFKRSVGVRIGSWGSKGIKKVIFAVVIVTSVSICFIGIKTNAAQQHQRRLEYAEATIKNETKKINNLDREVRQFYQNNQEEFLTEPTDAAKVKAIEKEIIALKTTSADFGLADKDFSINNSTVVEEKKRLVDKIMDVKNKLAVQEQIADLLVEKPNEWNGQDVTIVIDAKTTAEEIMSIRNKISQTQNSWDNRMNTILHEMDAQVKQYNDLSQTISIMTNDGILANNVSMDSVITSYNQVAQVKNETLKKELSDKLAVVDELLKNQSGVETGNTLEAEMLIEE